jgi:hypothetical protein
MCIGGSDFGAECRTFEVFDKTALTQLRVVPVAQSPDPLDVLDATLIDLFNSAHRLTGWDTIGMISSSETNGFDLV